MIFKKEFPRDSRDFPWTFLERKKPYETLFFSIFDLFSLGLSLPQVAWKKIQKYHKIKHVSLIFTSFGFWFGIFFYRYE